MDIPGIVPPSLLAERLEELACLYSRTDAAVSRFAEASGVSCPGSCGKCCEGFVPDILPVEASYIAAFIAGADRAMADSIVLDGLEPRIRPDGTPYCPMYRDEGPWHCGIYEARPLVCRMFAFSAVRDRLGESSYSVCRHGHSGRGVRAASGAGLAGAFGSEPPVMADMGSELSAIDPASAGERRPLPGALAEAVGRVLFIIGLGDPLDGGPDLSPTMPRAG